MRLNLLVKFSVVGLMLCAGSAQAQTAVEQRLQRIERILDNSALIDMVQRIESLQGEVRQLRGELEEKDNAIAAMRERQRKIFLDTDNRLSSLESGGGGGSGGGSFDELDDLEDLEAFASGSDGEVSLSSVPAASVSVPQQVESDERQEKLDYQNAYDLLILGRNREAIAEFGNFLQVYPNGIYSDNAHYWLGEANYVERRFNEAIDHFNVVISRFPASPKVRDARLRKGFALYELQRYGEAREELVLVEQEYRGRSIAALARRRIEQMNNAGL